MHEDNQYTSLSKTGIQPTFFGKVMTFFALAVGVSVVGTYLTYTNFLYLFAQMPALMWIVFGAELILIFTSSMWSTKVPINRFLFALFALLSGITLAPLIALVVASPGGVVILTKALLATSLMFTATAIVGWTSKIDFSGLRGFLFMGLIGLIIVGVIGIFIPWSNSIELLFSGFGVLLFSGFVMYDIQNIKKYPEDRYIDAALQLYLDIFNLFIYILRFIMALSNRD